MHWTEKYKDSEYVGEVKERLEMVVTIDRIFPNETVFGTSYIHSMQDEDGNYLVWFSSKETKFKEGETYAVKVTIKDHKEYQGIKQTIINRVKVQ